MKVAAYDLDGVLSTSPPPSDKPWGRMNGLQRKQRKEDLLRFYRLATRLFEPPEEKFVVITARKDDPSVVHVTSQWLEAQFPKRITHLYMLVGARTVENVVEFKARSLRDCAATDFHEDNLRVLKGLEKAGVDCLLWHYSKGEMKLLSSIPR